MTHLPPRPLFAVPAILLSLVTLHSLNPGPDVLTFHGDRQRVGWNSAETTLTPAAVSIAAFGPVWNSPPFDSLTLAGRVYPPHLYASPLDADRVTLSSGSFAGHTLPLVFDATSNGYAHAVNASDSPGIAPAQLSGV